MKKNWRNMLQRKRILELLPKNRKPIEERISASNFDRKFHWQLGKEYFDGTRKQGYGGYKYDGRWAPVAKFLISEYKLNNKSRVLELGCAKGFLLTEFSKELPGVELWGLDISQYALNSVTITENMHLVQGNFESLPFVSDYFDLVISINSIHNILTINETIRALSEIGRVTRNSVISVAAYRTVEEKIFLNNWAVVATTYLHENEWVKIFELSGYQGDYDWFQPWNI